MSKTERTLFAGRYILQSPLGRGGMGKVIKATDTHMDRQVALKFLLDFADTNDELYKRFEREARTLASIGSHPNIVTIHDLGMDDKKQPYIVTEYIEGDPLSDRIQSVGRLGPKETIKFLAPIAKALGFAHNKGIIHRDVKSNNIMVTHEDDRPILIDFGIAHVLELTRLTKHGSIGTPRYMSPEQLDNGNLVYSSDLYSLGVVLYECLTGQTPFGASSSTSWPVLCRLILTEPHVPVREVEPSVPQALSDIIDRCLIKDPAERNTYFSSGKQLAEALEDAITHTPVSYPPLQLDYPVRETIPIGGAEKPAGRKMVRWAAFVAIALGVVVLGWFGLANVLSPSNLSAQGEPASEAVSGAVSQLDSDSLGSDERSLVDDTPLLSEQTPDVMEDGLQSPPEQSSPEQTPPEQTSPQQNPVEPSGGAEQPVQESEVQQPAPTPSTAERKDPVAIYKEALTFANKNNANYDPEEARALLITAADMGYDEAQRMAGVAFFQGIGGDPDRGKAKEYLKKAADQNNIKAMVALADLHRMDTNCAEAVPLYRRAVGEEDAAAMYTLGMLYYEGVCVEKNTTEGLSLLQASAQKGEARAINYINNL